MGLADLVGKEIWTRWLTTVIQSRTHMNPVRIVKAWSAVAEAIRAKMTA
jgi:hypothetical protein